MNECLFEVLQPYHQPASPLPYNAHTPPKRISIRRPSKGLENVILYPLDKQPSFTVSYSLPHEQRSDREYASVIYQRVKVARCQEVR